MLPCSIPPFVPAPYQTASIIPSVFADLWICCFNILIWAAGVSCTGHPLFLLLTWAGDMILRGTKPSVLTTDQASFKTDLPLGICLKLRRVSMLLISLLHTVHLLFCALFSGDKLNVICHLLWTNVLYLLLCILCFTAHSSCGLRKFFPPNELFH